MATARTDVRAALVGQAPAALTAILAAAKVSPRGAETSEELATRIADAIWWNYTTPLGYAADRTSFEDIVGHVARKLRVDASSSNHADPYSALRELTESLFHQLPQDGVALDDLDEKTARRVRGTWLPTFAWGGGATGSVAARWTSGKVISFLKGPIGRWLPLIPPLAPWVGTVRTGAGAVHLVSGPLAIAMAVLTLNSALGTNYHRLVPLLLGVGALGAKSVEVAEEVP